MERGEKLRQREIIIEERISAPSGLPDLRRKYEYRDFF